jgi:hypothetical protein
MREAPPRGCSPDIAHPTLSPYKNKNMKKKGFVYFFISAAKLN